MLENNVNFNLLKWESPCKGLKYKKYFYKNKQVRLVEYTKEFVELDYCMKGHIGYVLEGKLEIDFNGKVIPYKAGDVIFIPSGEDNKHKAIIKSDKVKVIFSRRYSNNYIHFKIMVY
jgi:hypothetical protein